MNANCKSCGRLIPAGRERCNWCEHEQTTVAAGDSLAPTGEIGKLGKVLIVLFRLAVILFGLCLIAGGGVLGLCGVAMTHNPSDMAGIIGLALIPIVLGILAIYLALFRRNRGVGDQDASAAPSDETP